MVSELSARLMRGYNYNAPTSAQQTKLLADYTGSRSTAVVSPNTISDHEPMMTISACTAKLQLISTKNPAKKARASSGPVNEPCFKRRKVDELQFAASCVKDDLTKGGLSYPALDTSLRHHLDLERNEDLTRGVSLISSGSVKTSPFLTNNGSNCSEMASMSDFGSLFAATYDCYGKPSGDNVSSNVTFVTNSDVGSICSTMSERSETSSIAPRLEDGLNGKKTVLEPTPEEKEIMKATALQREAIFSNPISIRDAFDNSNEARIVTLSFAPFLVVHVNPAYTRMTGLSPADILGKPFHEVIEDPACKANTAKASSLTNLHKKVTSFAQAKRDVDAANAKLRINISVVGPEPADRPASWDHKNAITHYMIALEEPKDEADDESEVVTDTTTSILPMEAPTVVSAIAPLVVPPVPILETPNLAHIPTMRLHCGVMG